MCTNHDNRGITPKPKLLPFNLEAAKAGAKLVTRNGRECRYVGVIKHLYYPVIVAFAEDGFEYIERFTRDGRYSVFNQPSNIDLFIVHEPKRVPFDLEKAKAGAKLVTREGVPAKFLHVLDAYRTDCVVVALYDDKQECIKNFCPDGHWSLTRQAHRYDLFILE